MLSKPQLLAMISMDDQSLKREVIRFKSSKPNSFSSEDLLRFFR
jgi:hypothetical protein